MTDHSCNEWRRLEDPAERFCLHQNTRVDHQRAYLESGLDSLVCWDCGQELARKPCYCPGSRY